MTWLSRTLMSVLIAANMLLVSLPHPATARFSPLITKQFIDGGWQSDAVFDPASQSAPGDAATTAETSVHIGGWGRMVGTSFGDGNAEIYLHTATSEGTLTRNLSNNHAEDTSARLNYAADQVTFVSKRDGNREIYRVNTDGVQVARLTATPTDDIQPFWSRDSQWIAFASKRSGNWNIYAMKGDGSGQTALTTDVADDVMPAWSPDGSKIAWVRISGTTGTIWMMNADGSGQKAISPPLAYLQHPNWSSDSARLVFDYDRDGDGFNELALINADGSGLQPVAVTMALDAGERADLSAAAWAPGDEWLLFGVVVYRLAGTQALVSSAYVGGVPTSGGWLSRVAYPLLAAEPDLRSIDLAAPVTRFEQLPLLTRGVALSVRWGGYDIGAAKDFTYDVQYRTAVNEPWKDWLNRVTSTEATFTGAYGTTVAFRVRGRDAAGNVEPWHNSQGDTATTFYAWRFAGQVTDNRGRPVPTASLTVTPNAIGTLATNADGRYVALLAQGGPHTIEIGSEGFAAPPATTLTADRDRAFSTYLLPTDTIIQNGTFEASPDQLNGWSHTGTLPASITINSHTGARAVQLGQPCVSPCLSEEQVIPAQEANAPSPTLLSLAADDAQGVHLLWMKHDGSTFFSGPEVNYQKRTPEGTWLAPVKIGNGGRAKSVIDSNQTVHVAWLSSENRLLYRQLPVGGAWSEPQDLGLATILQLAVDGQGRMYAFYYCWSVPGCANTGEGMYRIRETDGTWQPERTLPFPVSAVAAAPDGTVRVMWHQSDLGYVATVRADGSTSAPAKVVPDGYQVFQPQFVVDAQGLAHIVWSLNQDMYYVQELPDGTFTLPMRLSSGDQARLAEAQGTLYLVTTSNDQNTYGIYIRSKAGTSEWSEPTLLFRTTYGQALLASDHRGRAHVVRQGNMSAGGWQQLYYQATSLDAEAGEAALAQTVTIPSAMHKPTLAFEYQLTGGGLPETGSQLVVRITDETTQQVFNVGTSAGWKHSAVDLTRWANKTVTVTIALAQAANAPRATAFVDDISIGSWRTPVVESVSQSQVEAFLSTEVTIAGDNFLATPTVHLGTTALTDVQLVDEATLKATIPVMKPGQYRLLVTNPGGQRAVGHHVTVGHMVYLPSAIR